MNKILELKQKRAALVKQMRELIDLAEKENRSLDEEQYNRIEKEVDELGKAIDREERMAKLEQELYKVDEVRTKPNPEKRDFKNLRETEEYRNAFWKALKEGRNALSSQEYNTLMNPEVRSLAVGTDAAGGYLVPDEFERQLIQIIESQNVMRGLATVITTSSGTREIPVESDYGTATWLGENAAYTESDAQFSQKTLSAYKLGTLIKVSEELLQDSFFDISNYIANAFARRFAKAEEAAFVNGDGTGKPTGVIADATEGKVGQTGQTTSVTADDLIDLYHALKRPYRMNAAFLMNDSTAKVIRKLKDNDGQYLWQPGLQLGQPDRLLGRPVYISDDVPVMAANAKSILFGDFSHYWIADRKGATMQRLDELYAANGQVGFRMYKRVDGKLIRNDAVVYYQNSAT
jgi:HK97 family phage major capsid protein